MVLGTRTTWSDDGSAAAGGCVVSLNPQQMRWVWITPGSRQEPASARGGAQTEHIEKRFVLAAWALATALWLRWLVQSGWTGVSDILSGSENFMQAYSPRADPAGWIEKLGERYEGDADDYQEMDHGGPIQSRWTRCKLF